MNKPLRHVWLVVTLLFALLFGSTTYFQVIAQDRLNADGRNARTIYNEFGTNRGPIVVDGQPIAQSQESDGPYGYLRSYDPGEEFAHVTGYYSVVYGFAGIERALNDTLSGDADALFYQRIVDVLAGRQAQGAAVELTLDTQAQEAAWDALEGQRGAVVALDPGTGEILAMVSSPSYDPNDLASHSPSQVREAWSQLNEDPERPMTNRAIGGDLYPPGSSFKPLVAAAALESGEYTKDSVIPGPGVWTLPGTSTTMNNFAGGNQEACGPGEEATMEEAMRQSCNTSFAMLGVELGEETLDATLADYGFGERGQIPLGVTPSTIGDDLNDAQVATTSIGQYETRVTPLQMAMVAGSFVNDGVVMAPNLVGSVRTQNLQVVSEFSPREYSQPLTASNATQMREMLVTAVEDGTGSAAAIDGAEVGGKTGTAQWGDDRAPHSWFMGHAQAEDREVAVAVVVEEGGYGSQVAAPIAQDVMQAVVQP